MSIPDTTNTSPVFIIDAPDFSEDYEVVPSFRTDVTAARNGGEQRARRQMNPRYSVGQTLAPLGSDSWPVRKSKMIRELGAPVVIPIWVFPVDFVSETSDVVTVGVNISKREFRVGSYAFFEESGLASCFRLIEEIGATTITCETGNAAFPDITVPTYTSAAKVFPCVLGIRQENSGESYNVNPKQAREMIRVDQL